MNKETIDKEENLNMDKLIIFKTNPYSLILPIVLSLTGGFLMYTSGPFTIHGILGLLAFLFALHLMNSEDISSIKRYLNEKNERRDKIWIKKQ